MISAGLTLATCNVNELEFKNLEVQPIEGVFGVPLGEIKYTLRDLLEEANIQDPSLEEDSTSLLSLSYSDTISFSNPDDLFQIGDITGMGTYGNTIIATNTNPGGTQNINLQFTEYVRLYDPVDGEELDSAFHETGELQVTFTSDADVQEVDFTIRFDNTVNTNTRTPIGLTATAGRPVAGGTVSANAVANLADHVTLTGGATNEMIVSFAGRYTLNPGDQLNGDETLTFDFTYANQTFSVVYGKFGQDTLQLGSEELAIDFFQDLEPGIILDAPTLRFNFTNSFGVPMAVDFSSLAAEGSVVQDTVYLTGIITTPENLPEIPAAPDPTTFSTSAFEISSVNSNIRDLFATSPARLFFDVVGLSNYYDPNNTESNFVSTGNEVEAIIDIEMPLSLRLEDYQKAFRFNLSEGLDLDNIDSAFLRVITINELPFSGELALEIQNANEEVTFTIPERVVVTTPIINVNGLVEDARGATADIPLSPEALDSLATGSYLNMVLTMNTPKTLTSNEIYVKVLADYEIDIKVGLGGLVNYSF